MSRAARRYLEVVLLDERGVRLRGSVVRILFLEPAGQGLGRPDAASFGSSGAGTAGGVGGFGLVLPLRGRLGAGRRAGLGVAGGGGGCE